jgi:hypothetical protein
MSGQSLQAEVRRAYLQHPLGRRLAALMVLAGAVAVLLAGMGIMGLAASNESLRAMHEQRMTPVRQLSRVHQLILTNRLLLRTALSAVQLQNGPSDSATLVMDAHIARASADAMEENLATIADLWRAYTSRPLTAPSATPLIQRDPTAVWKLALGLSVLFNLLLVYWLGFLPK